MVLYKMKHKYESFPSLEKIGNAFYSGEFIIRGNKDNGELYTIIHYNEENFKALYKDFGFDLIHDDDGYFYYLDKLDAKLKIKSGVNTRSICVFIATLLADLPSKFFLGREIFEREFSINDLPHFKNKMSEERLLSENIKESNLRDILNKMKKRKIISYNNNATSFRFNTPVLIFTRYLNELSNLSNDKDNDNDSDNKIADVKNIKNENNTGVNNE